MPPPPVVALCAELESAERVLELALARGRELAGRRLAGLRGRPGGRWLSGGRWSWVRASGIGLGRERAQGTHRVNWGRSSGEERVVALEFRDIVSTLSDNAMRSALTSLRTGLDTASRQHA